MPVDPKGSNELLFSLLCDKFREIHNREENLTSQECSRFLELMGKRMRDLGQNPFPFQHTSNGKNPAGTAASFKGKDRQVGAIPYTFCLRVTKLSLIKNRVSFVC